MDTNPSQNQALSVFCVACSPNIGSMKQVDAINEMSSPKNLKLFADLNILNKTELEVHFCLRVDGFVPQNLRDNLGIVRDKEDMEVPQTEMPSPIRRGQFGWARLRKEPEVFAKLMILNTEKLEDKPRCISLRN